MKKFRLILSLLLVCSLVLSMMPVIAVAAQSETANNRGVNNYIIIDDDATGGYEGDYVVIYNPATSSSTSYSTGTMTGLIETTVNPSYQPTRKTADDEMPLYKIDVDSQLAEIAETEEVGPSPEPTRASYSVGDTKTFSIYSYYSPTGSGSVQFKCLYVGSHCYIWTPTSSANNTYPLDTIDSSFAQLAADEFDSKFDLMQSSFGNHTNGSNGDGKLHMLYYNIDDEWEPGQGYVAGFFYNPDISNNGLPILNIDTYPGVYYVNSSGTVYKSMDDTYNTMVHEYQHLINYSNTSGMSSWLNECFSAAAEEICYPGSSVVSRIQSWENYRYSTNNDWLDPPEEFQYQSSNSLHNGYSMYAWSNSLDNTSLLTLYSQVSFFAQYLFTRFGNTIYRQISNKYSSSETSAITSATGVNVADLVRDFRIAVTANAAQSQYDGIYGFKVQNGYDPSNYHDVQSPWDLLSPVVFTGSSCSIKGGGAITVKPVNGVYNPPSGASSSLKYYGIKFEAPYTVTAVSNNTSYGTVSVSRSTITAVPANGYYVESCDVISGTATFTITGNTIKVSPESDCTIRVNFAPKPLYTVNFIASGVYEGSQTAYVNDAITLPNSVSNTASGWTFVGWMDHQIDETTTKPTYYAPGASYTVNGNATLYTVYARVEEGTGSVIYQQVNDLEDDAEYILVDVNAISGTSGYAVGNAIVADSHYLTAVSVTVNSDNTVTATSANLPNILWKADAVSNGFTFYNQNVGKYMGLDSSEYLYPSATALAWAYTSEGYMNNQIDSEGYYYLSYDTTNTRYTTNMSGRVINLYKAVNDSTTYYWTDPIAGEHEHELVFHAAAAPTCTEVGNSAYYQCSICGKCFTDAAGENEITLASTVIAALGHNYVGVVTAPTETQQGYTTYTCSRCGDQYVDDYVPALGSDFTVHFSVPAGVTKPADMVSNTNTGITLPTVTGPEGYTFLGWVTEDYDNVETRPATILTGNYIAPQEITLKALFSYVGDGSGETVYQLVDALKDGGKYIIVDSNSISGTSGYAVGNTIVASNHYLNAVSVTINDNTATASNVANVLWQAAAASNGFTFYNAAVGKYMGLDSSEYLYPSDTAVAWAYTSDSYLDNQIDSEGYYYLSFDTTNTRYTTNKSGKVIYLYEETTLGTTLYTTIIGEEHVHTPGNPVVENNVEPTCTAAGSYDNVVYCTECGEELSRETVTVPALGHAPLAAVVENNVEPTCTVAGSYDNVVYCERCNAELSRETVTVAALNHLPGAAVQENYVEPTATEYGGYDMVVYCQRCNAELSREHTVLDPTGTPEPELDESLTFYTSVSIGAEIKTTFTIRQTVLTNAASWYLEVSKLDGSGNVLESKRFGEGQEGAVTNVSNVAWRAVYTDITAKEMGVTFAAVLHVFDADGNEFYGNAVENTVKDYIVGELVKTDNTAATRTLCADMLNYGAAAQLYFAYDTDNLVNENLSAAAAAALDQFETKTEAPATLVNGSNGPNLYGSVSIKNRVVLSITARNLGTGTTVQIQVKNHETGEVKEVLETTQVGSVYTSKFSNVEANEMRTMFDFVALVDGVETGTPLTWSVEGYVRAARLSSDVSAEELALYNALLIYTDSAAAIMQ